MPRFGRRSRKNLQDLHPDLLKVANEAIKHYDFTVIEGWRGEEEQNKAFRQGFSKAKFGQSPHIYGLAFDAIPYPFKEEDWKDEVKFKAMADAILKAADIVGIAVTWGGNFKSIHDTPHFELTDWRNLKYWK